MIVECIVVGALGANCYIVGCEETGEAAVLDPGGDSDKIKGVLDKKNLKLKYIIDTHGHIDHIAANDKLKDATGAQLLIHELDAEMLGDPMLNLSELMGFSNEFKPADRTLNDGDILEVGKVKLEVMHTPGHTRGGISLATDGAVFTGDTLFNVSIGRTDFPGGNYETIINSIKTKLMPLPDETAVYPGHMGSSTIGYERKHNPFIR